MHYIATWLHDNSIIMVTATPCPPVTCPVSCLEYEEDPETGCTICECKGILRTYYKLNITDHLATYMMAYVHLFPCM